jgi:dihydroorotate dehydrogenase electron transfer subunit
VSSTVVARPSKPETVRAQVQLVHVPLAGREEMARETWFLHFELPELANAIRPGEFFMVSVRPPIAHAFLKRPFSVADAAAGRLTFLLRAYGEGTAVMARRCVGDEFDLLGPLGRAFDLESPVPRVVMVAGGIGLAPFFLLARKLKELPHPPETLLLYGERTQAALTRRVESFPYFDRVLICTDDGTAGRRGNVVQAFRGLAEEGALSDAWLSACGPRPMLEALEVERERLGVPGEYSMEERMGCGFGVCQGCVVPANPAVSEQAYYLLCKSGPVMNPELLLWPHQTLP